MIVVELTGIAKRSLTATAIAMAALVGVTLPAGAAAGSNVLSAGQELRAGQALVSAGGQYKLNMQSSDGNLVVYNNGVAIWASNTAGTGGGNHLAMQADGNLVVYTSAGKPVWASNTVGIGCHANTCTGLNPASHGCNRDARTVGSYTSGSYTVNLRYSPACYAAWAQITGPYSSEWGGAIDGFTSQSQSSPVVQWIASPPSPGGTYSLMVSFHYWTRACLARNDSGWFSPPDWSWCTGLH